MRARGMLALALVGLCALASPAEAKRLGEWPLCEASAATRDPSSAGHVLVADNEHSGALFAFELGAGGLESMHSLALPGGEGLRDIEALATSGERVLVVASHSRNKECEPKDKRWQLRWLRRGPANELREESAIDSARLRARIGVSTASCLAALFGPAEPAGARVLCEALSQGERAPKAAHCDAMNIEGAAALPDTERANKPDRIWLGLRNPLVGGRAVLLRMTSDTGPLRFDAVAFIDLAGRGIRELTFRDHMLWGIAGPSADLVEPFTLFGVRASALVPGARLPVPARQRPLPPLSEGLVIDGARAIVVTDGEVGEPNRRSCERPSSQQTVVLP